MLLKPRFSVTSFLKLGKLQNNKRNLKFYKKQMRSQDNKTHNQPN